MIDVPESFIATTVEREGSAAEAWIAALPHPVAEHCRLWDLEVTGPVRHGYVAIVVPVSRDGVDLALKISWIDRSSEQEALVLRAWNGRGAVRLLASREAAGALLLEWLNPDRTLALLPPLRAARIAGVLLRRLAIPAPEALRTVREEADSFVRAARQTWHDRGRPFPAGLLEHAIELCGAEPASDEARIVNLDLHYDNVLEGTREPWSVIDPKALAGPPEFGVAQLLWSRFDELGDRAAMDRRLRVIAEAAGLDATAARQWSIVRVADFWLWALGEGLADEAAKCRVLIEWLAPEFAA